MIVALVHDEITDGSTPDELDVLAQMDAIEASLLQLGHTPRRIPCTLDLEAMLHAISVARADRVFNLVESLGGSGRLIHLPPAAFDALGIPYTGCPADAAYCTSNKLLAKRLMHSAGIPTPTAYTRAQLQAATTILHGRYILKSVWEHASRGLDEDSVVPASSPADLLSPLESRLPSLGREAFAEQYVDGREFNLSLLGGRGCTVLPPAEIIFDGYAPEKPRVVGYRAKWDASSFEYHHTPRRFDFPPEDKPLLRQLSTLATRCWSLFDLRGYARVDFRLDPAGNPWVLEVNANPCLAPDAGYAAALARAGISYTDAIARILADIPVVSR